MMKNNWRSPEYAVGVFLFLATAGGDQALVNIVNPLNSWDGLDEMTYNGSRVV